MGSHWRSIFAGRVVGLGMVTLVCVFAEAQGATQGESFTLASQAIAVRGAAGARGVAPFVVLDRLHETEVTVADPFSILLTDGRIYNSRNLSPVGKMEKRALEPRSDTARVADRMAGEIVEAPFVSRDGLIEVNWSLILLKGWSVMRSRTQ